MKDKPWTSRAAESKIKADSICSLGTKMSFICHLQELAHKRFLNGSALPRLKSTLHIKDEHLTKVISGDALLYKKLTKTVIRSIQGSAIDLS